MKGPGPSCCTCSNVAPNHMAPRNQLTHPLIASDKAGLRGTTECDVIVEQRSWGGGHWVVGGRGGPCSATAGTKTLRHGLFFHILNSTSSIPHAHLFNFMVIPPPLCFVMNLPEYTKSSVSLGL
ncbi:hypothetical protein CesoFtcFv8_011474 [Champsocephalus esox]|uniref:Uncharacterized protein n=1 Tax=Champsocephalus esox TaxID=159716 RepID=A0AAN8C4A6_9TELE|nr:hypothetical protein CesoFtcFv8_011474 [Champsocephalus esox]